MTGGGGDTAQVKDPPPPAAGGPESRHRHWRPVCTWQTLPSSQSFRTTTTPGCALLSGHELWEGQGVPRLLSREELALSSPLVGRARIKEAC